MWQSWLCTAHFASIQKIYALNSYYVEFFHHVGLKTHNVAFNALVSNKHREIKLLADYNKRVWTSQVLIK